MVTDSIASHVYEVAGIYTVTLTVISDLGCANTTTLTLSINGPVIDRLVFRNPKCFGDNNGLVGILYSGGTPPLSLAWNTGETANVLYDLGAGMYIATVTDSMGCTVTDTATLEAPPEINIDLTDCIFLVDGIDSLECVTVGPAIATGGVPGYNYSWSNGAIGPTNYLCVKDTPEVILTVSDASSFGLDSSPCSATDTIQIQVLDLTCEADTGIDRKPPQGTPGIMMCFSFQGIPVTQVCVPEDEVHAWQDMGYVIGPCSYTDPCTGLPFSLRANPATPVPFAMRLHPKNISCKGETDGAINLSIRGAKGKASIRWSTGSTEPNISGLSPGVYSVTVTDSETYKQLINSITLSEPESPLQASLEIINESCSEGDGYAEAIVTGGTPPYQYAWSNGTYGSAASGLSKGIHEVNIYDQGGCATSLKAIVEEQLKILVEVSLGDVLYKGLPDFDCNDLTAVPLSGTAPYVFHWNNHKITPTIHECPDQSQSYAVTVTDVNGCTGTERTAVSVVNIMAEDAPGRVNMCSNLQLTEVVSIENVPAMMDRGWKLGSCAQILPTQPGTREDLTQTGIDLLVYPNPFQESAKIEFKLPQNDHVTLRMYSASGIEVARLFNGKVNAGKNYVVEFQPKRLASGLYFLRITQQNGRTYHAKLVYTK